MSAIAEEIAAAAARLVVEEGMEYGPAKAKAARDLGRRSGRRADLPGNEQVEDAVREHLALFHAETQPGELRALRELALHWMQRLEAFRPHVAGAVWRGTATRLSALHLDLYCDDAKAAEIALINAGLRFDADHLDRAGAEPLLVLTLAVPCRDLGEPVTLHLSVHDRDDERGALRPDARGRSWRGDRGALQRLLAGLEAAALQASGPDIPQPDRAA
jgi:hypothetical protein